MGLYIKQASLKMLWSYNLAFSLVYASSRHKFAKSFHELQTHYPKLYRRSVANMFTTIVGFKKTVKKESQKMERVLERLKEVFEIEGGI